MRLGPDLIRRTAAWLLVPAALCGLVLVQAGMFRATTSETFDETIYLKVGVVLWHHGDFRILSSPMSPPLPILLESWLPALRARSDPESVDWEREAPARVREARLLTALTVGVPLAWAVYGWLGLRRGWVAGALGGGLVALSPSILAAASVATTDACFALFVVVALAALHRDQVRSTWGSFALAGAAMGLALASKQSAVILVPVALGEMVWKGVGRDSRPDRLAAWLSALPAATARLAALIAIAFGVDWALYGFALAPTFASGGGHASLPVLVPMVADLFPNREAIMAFVWELRPPLALDTFLGQLDHATAGHPAFLMGRHSHHGWWYFFPVAIALKSTSAELLMFGLAAFFALRPSTWADPARRLWLGTLVTLLGSGLASALNIGQRYMLPAYPLVVLLAVDAIGAIGARHPRRMVAVGGVLLAWQAVSAVGIAPHYLSYFNGLCGGPMEGYRSLVDSSLDWGQDLPSLRRELEERGYRKVALAYFGTASPRAYGLRSMDALGREEPVASGCDWLAVSATSLQAAYGGPFDVHDFERLPSARAGYTIFLYDLKDPRVRAALEATRRRAN